MFGSHRSGHISVDKKFVQGCTVAYLNRSMNVNITLKMFSIPLYITFMFHYLLSTDSFMELSL